MNAPRSINVDYINPFIEATINTFTTMANVVPTREKVFLKGEGEEVYGVSGIIGLGGEATGAVGSTNDSGSMGGGTSGSISGATTSR